MLGLLPLLFVGLLLPGLLGLQLICASCVSTTKILHWCVSALHLNLILSSLA